MSRIIDTGGPKGVGRCTNRGHTFNNVVYMFDDFVITKENCSVVSSLVLHLMLLPKQQVCLSC